MIKTIFVILLVVFLIVIIRPGGFGGSVDQPVELPKKEVAKIRLHEDRVKEYAYFIKDVRDDREAQVGTNDALVLSLLNRTDFTLTKVVAKITNKKNQEAEDFRLFPVSGSLRGRANPRIYHADPHGASFWSGNFGRFLHIEDEISINILSANGFK